MDSFIETNKDELFINLLYNANDIYQKYKPFLYNDNYDYNQKLNKAIEMFEEVNLKNKKKDEVIDLHCQIGDYAV